MNLAAHQVSSPLKTSVLPSTGTADFSAVPAVCELPGCGRRSVGCAGRSPGTGLFDDMQCLLGSYLPDTADLGVCKAASGTRCGSRAPTRRGRERSDQIPSAPTNGGVSATVKRAWW